MAKLTKKSRQKNSNPYENCLNLDNVKNLMPVCLIHHDIANETVCDINDQHVRDLLSFQTSLESVLAETQSIKCALTTSESSQCEGFKFRCD
jgi:hypothetical protein